MDDVVTPLLRSLRWRTRSFVWGYLEKDDGMYKEGRVELLEVPDGALSVNADGYKDDVTLVGMENVGNAESVRFLHDPADASGPFSTLDPNLTPPRSGAWITGNVDPAIPNSTPYFTVCKSTSPGGAYHLFRNGIAPTVRAENFFQLYYTNCEEVAIHAERVHDEKICFSWDLAGERGENALTDIMSKRLFTLYHNSLLPNIPRVITPEIDEILTQTPSNTPNPSTLITNAVPNKGQTTNTKPDQKFYFSPQERIRTASNPREGTISTINNLDNEDNTFFTDFKDFIGDGRGTPVFGTEGSAAGSSGNEADRSGNASGSGSGSGVTGGGSERLELPDEINTVGSIKITPGGLLNRISQKPRNGENLLRVSEQIVDNNPASGRKETIQMQDLMLNSQIQSNPLLRPRPQPLLTSKSTGNSLLRTGSNLLPVLSEPRTPMLPPLSRPSLKDNFGLPTFRSGSIPSTGSLVDRPKGAGYQPISGLNANTLLPKIRGGSMSLQNSPDILTGSTDNLRRGTGRTVVIPRRPTTPRTGIGGLKLQPLPLTQAIQEEEDVLMESTPFNGRRAKNRGGNGNISGKPLFRSSPSNMYVTTENIGFPIVQPKSPLEPGENKKGYLPLQLPESFGTYAGRAPIRGIGTNSGLSTGITLPNVGSRTGLAATRSYRPVDFGSPPISPDSRPTSPLAGANRNVGRNSPRPRTPSPPSGTLNGNNVGGTRRTPSRASSGSRSRNRPQKKSRVPKFKSSREFVKWLKQNRPGGTSLPGSRRSSLVSATAQINENV